MAEMQRTLVTKEGLENLQKQLDELRSVKRAEVAQRLKEAIAMGDLSENSEYDEAKNAKCLEDLRLPPSNHLEQLVGNRKGRIQSASHIHVRPLTWSLIGANYV